ncbi:MAG TPA: hypothetical protein VKD90_01605, partial [Gemmataceae bacterium]|nr:hypothetical protein [Gemmataceae bacterium]
LDEPLGQLDSALAEKLSQDLLLLRKQSRLTILHVTHDPIEALALADRVGLLGGGRILQSGTPDEVYTRPGSRTVGLHFGRPPINLFDGSADGTGFTNGWLQVPCPHRGTVTLGVRPEDVAFSAQDGFIQVGEGEVTANRRVDGRHLITVAGPHGEIRGFNDRPLDARVSICLRADRLHWFDQGTGNRID